MISREQLKQEIDSVDDRHIEALHSIILSLKKTSISEIPPTSISRQTNPLKNSIVFETDIISPIDVAWDAES